MDPSIAPIPLMILGLLLMLFTLRRFDGLFKEDTLFLLFIAGMILGFASIVLEYLIFPMEKSFKEIEGVLTIYFSSSAIYVIGSAILAEGFKAVVINLRRFRLVRETTFLGFALGIGFGSTSAIMPFYQFTDYVYPRGVILPIMISIVYILLNGATGLILGAGSARGQTMSSFAQAFGVHALFSLGVLGAAFFVGYISSYPYLAIGFGMVASAFILFTISLKLFYWGLPDEEKRKIRRKIRSGDVGRKSYL
jgi:divalent metal cation (Fe/Co/Zn/Cd) transporter